MKIKKALILVFLLFEILIQQEKKATIKSWCWTKPVKKSEESSLNPEMGGINWGYCSVQGPAKNEKAPYRVFVETANIKDAGAQGQFYITMFGEEGFTDEILLTSSGFLQGSTTIVKFMANNIGDVNKIRIRNGGTQKYRCSKVRIEYGSKFWDFDCQNWLECPKKCQEDLNLTGNQRYQVNIQTASKQDAGTKDALFIELYGVEGKTSKKILQETGFNTGGVDTIDMQNNDVGLIYGIKICSEGTDQWSPETIKIIRAGSEESQFDPKGQSIGCPSMCCLTIKNPKPGAEESSDSSDSGSSGSGSESGAGGAGVGGASADEEEDPATLANDYQGNALTAFEKQKMITLGCDDIIKGNENFGPSFSNNVPNFQMIIAKCPPGCYKAGAQGVFGMSIHNEESSICKSAVIDNASPLSGGVIGVGVVQGVDKYDSGGVIKGIEVKGASKSIRSMFTFKIDNVDFADKELRIINNNGQPDFQGRIEIRINGQWGTLCSKGTSIKIGRSACRMMKYLDGQLMNPPSTEGGVDFCSNYLGQDYCGYEPQPIHFMAVQCNGGEQALTDCYRELATGCTHMDDVIVECSNINFDTPQVPEKGTIRLIDENGSPSMQNVGHLEIYLGQWSTICNTKFNPKGAEVICKQMGYEGGELIGNPSQNGVCANLNGKNYCGQGTIAMKDVNCQGNEVKLQQCPTISNPTDCSHDQDLMIKCEGAGDPSGKSQKKVTNPLGPPPLGKLPLPPIMGANCQTTLQEKVFRGDEGSIYLVNCPSGCATDKGSVWGTGIYSYDSSICRAAIHAGVNQNMGGLVLVIKAFGQKAYTASTRRLVASSAYSLQPFSFLVSIPNSLAVKLVKMYDEQKGGGAASFIQYAESFNSYTNTQSSLLSKLSNQPTYDAKQIQLYDSYQNNNKRKNIFKYDHLKKILKFYSFIDAGAKKITKQPEIFKWTPPNPGFKFNGKDSIVKTDGLPGVEKTGGLQAFSFVISANMLKQPNKIQTLLGHSGCNGYALTIDPTNELNFQTRCTENQFRTGYKMPLDSEVHIVITYDKQIISAYVDANLYNKEKKAFNFKCDKSFDIGSYSDVQDQVFNGEINYVVVYDYPLSSGEILKLFENGVPADPKGFQVGMRFTADQRLCTTPCTTNPAPGQPGSQGAPGDSALGQADYGPGSDVQEGIEEVEDNTPQQMPSNGLSIELNCDTPGTDSRLQGPTGKTFRATCPKKCHLAPIGNVIGTQIYTDQSSICKAAIHSGIIDREKEGEFMIQISNGESYYQGSFQNEVQSAAFGESLRSITFKAALPIQRVACKDTMAQAKFGGKVGMRYVVKCPKDCSKEEQEVFGDSIYTDDSKVCQAGIHAGLLTDKGGELEIAIEEGQKKYPAKMKNGINSLKRDTHIRSFRLIGDKSLTCEFFQESYNPANIYMNWKMEDAKGAQKGPSDWMFNTNPTDPSLCIQQISQVSGSQYNYGTTLIRKEFDCNDYVLKVNLYFEVLSQAIILFRYSDPNNYYALEINLSGQKPLVLAKKTEAIGASIAEADFALVPKTWYRFRILMAEDKLEVWSQQGQLRNLQLIMEVEDEDQQKGTVAIATEGDAQVSFDGIEVMAYDKLVGVFDKFQDHKPNWDTCLQGTTSAARKKFCKKLYGTYQVGLDKCVHLYNFCNTCCDFTIPKILNIYNFACYKQCINEAKALERRQNQEKLAQMEAEAILNNKWRPQEGEKVDYKPSVLGDATYFVPAKIESIDIKHKNVVIPEEQKLKIKFFIDGKENQEEILYPNKILTKCGESLQGRTDCAD